jgi:peptide/nickel transport system substrate-binding protein
VGIVAKLQNVEWAQWLANTYGGAHNYDLTIVSHVEPFDLGNFAKPDYYWGYRSAKFDELYGKYKSTANAKDRTKLLGEIQTLIATDSVHAFLYQPQWVTVANKNVRGLWKDMPIFVNDLSSMSWA